jgi:hypothetical protein
MFANSEVCWQRVDLVGKCWQKVEHVGKNLPFALPFTTQVILI